jgi:formylglycine-generating enzyme required for sulfatase activity
MFTLSPAPRADGDVVHVFLGLTPQAVRFHLLRRFVAFERSEMRSKLLRRSIFISALIVFLGLLSFHSSWLSIEGATSAQDPNATLPSPKKTTPPKKTTTTTKPPARKTTRPTTSGSKTLPRTRTNQAGIEFVLIPPGSLMMGSVNGAADEKPVHQVTIGQAFYMGKYEVTQAQWQSVMGSNPSNFKGDNLPVETVSWDDAVAFIARLNAQNDGFAYRLPTEAEWEYACRAGTTGDYAGDLDAMAWYGNNSGRGRLDAAEIYRTDSANYYKRITENGGQTHAVGTKLPNSFGLFDMHGNVWEWCQDWYHDSYNGAPTDGSAWLSGGEQKYRVMRGGSWYADAAVLRSAARRRDTPGYDYNLYGFRVVAVR